MILKQKVTVILTAILFLVGAGAIEGEWWWITPLAFLGMAVCVIIGQLGKRQTDAKTVLKEYGVK
jgi:hypothetical protein